MPIESREGRKLWIPSEVWSGGQTGIDRVAMDAAMAAGIKINGFAPKGFRAEDGVIPEPYRSAMTEAPTTDYGKRTEANVRRTEATVVITDKPLGMTSPGTRLTLRCADEIGRPAIAICTLNTANLEKRADALIAFLLTHCPERLNVAGPRASKDKSGLAARARRILEISFGLR